MHVVMIKKRLANGEPCRKCAQAEELLRSRGLWDRIDEVVWADENDPSSPGMRLGEKYGVAVAPFFVVRADDGPERVYESALKFIKEELSEAPRTLASGSAADSDVESAAQALAERDPADILKWGIERHGAALGIAFSGAEDVVLIHMAKATGLPFSVFCLDTGRLHPETYQFVDRVRRHFDVEIAVMSPEPVPLQALVREKGLFSFYEDGHEECCGIRKVEPLRRALSGLDAWATGQRKDQSPATRGQIPVVERDRSFSGRNGSLLKLNPLANWSSARVWQYIREHSVPFNPLHERGYVSIGCEPCTRAILPGEHERAGRWWWEDTTKRECGLHIANTRPPRPKGA
jgi:phosphoadenosine phosphosulfate reductase